MDKRELLLLSIGTKFLVFSVSIVLVGLHYAADYVLSDTVLNETIEVGKPALYDSDGKTPLMRAANCDNMFKSIDCIDQVRKMIAEGQPLDAQSHNLDMRTGKPELNTALHFALFNANYPDFDPTNHGEQQVYDLLLDAGVNVRIPNANGDTPVHFLIQVQNLDRRTYLLSRFIKRGADINARNNQGKTLVHLLIPATEIQFLEILKSKFGLLVQMNLRDNQGKTANDLAIELGHSDLSNTIFNPQDERYKPLPVIDIYDNLEKRDDTMGLTPLALALLAEDEKKVKALIDRMANVNAQTIDHDKNSILHMMLLAQDIEAVNMLLNYNINNLANPNIANAAGDRPLHYVLKIDHYGKSNSKQMIPMRNTAAGYLLSRGADINAQNNDGNTVLHLAVAADAVDLVKFLLQNYSKKINLTILNKSNQSALDVARLFNNKEMIKVLSEKK